MIEWTLLSYLQQAEERAKEAEERVECLLGDLEMMNEDLMDECDLADQLAKALKYECRFNDMGGRAHDALEAWEESRRN